MRRPTHVCATCSEHFTRRYSATRHNLTIHKGIGEIVPYLEYLVGRNSGRYRPSHPSLYRRGRGEKRNHNFRHADTVAVDSMGDTFRHRDLQGYHHPQSPAARSVTVNIPTITTYTSDTGCLNSSAYEHNQRCWNSITRNYAKDSRTQKAGI